MYILSVIILRNGTRRNNLPLISICNNRNFAAPKQDNNLDEFSMNKFFNICEALALLSVNQFGCGFILWLNFFTEQIIMCVDIVKAATAEPLLVSWKISVILL